MAYWWQQKAGKAHDLLNSTFKVVWDQQRDRRIAMMTWQMLYSQRKLTTTSGKGLPDELKLDKAVTENIVKSIIDTSVARVATRRVRPMFLTEGGDFTLKERARMLNLWTGGQLEYVKMHQKAKMAFRDAGIFGNGGLAIIDGGSCIKVERIYPLELIVDDEEAKYGEPRQIFRFKEVTKEVLAARYPKHAQKIMTSTQICNDNFEATGAKRFTSDMTTVVEAFHLPSSDGAGDGRHVIAVDTGTILDEEWDRDYFPFSIMRWSEPVEGWWGIGLCEVLQPLQTEHDNVNSKIMETMEFSGMKIFAEKGSINAQELGNEVGSIYYYTGVMPTVHNPPAVSPDDWNRLEGIKREMYDVSGFSEWTATGTPPAGWSNAKALRERYDQEGQRHNDVAQAYEDMIIRATEMIIDVAKEIDARGDGYEIIAEDDKELRRLKFRDVDIERDKVRLKCFPVNFMPSTPSGKWQQVQEMLEANFLTQEEAAELLDFPDIESITGRKNSQYRIVERDIRDMLEGRTASPQPFNNLQLSAQMAQMAYQKARLDEYPEGRLELLRRYILMCKDMMALQQAPRPMPQLDPTTGMQSGPQPTMGPQPQGMPIPGMQPQQAPIGAEGRQ